MEPIENHINCETNGKIVGYIDLVKIDAPVWTNSMCNGCGHLSQDLNKHALTDTIYLFLRKDKPKDIRAAYVIEVCDIRPHKTETHITRLATGGNLIDYPGEVSTPTSDLTTMKLHVNSTISDVKLRYICMDMKDFYLNNIMSRAEYIMIQISLIPQECVDKYNLKKEINEYIFVRVNKGVYGLLQDGRIAHGGLEKHMEPYTPGLWTHNS